MKLTPIRSVFVCLFFMALLLSHQALAQPLNGDDLYLTDPTPGIVFDDTDTPGWNWVLRGRDEFFALSDEVNADDIIYVTPGNGSDRSLRFYVASDGALALNGSGDINLDGDLFIQEDLITAGEPIYVNDPEARIDVFNSGASGVKTLFTLSNAGNAKFEIIERISAKTWAFTNSGNDFRISLQDSGVVEFSVANNGNATLAGTLTQNSDRNAKKAIVPIDSQQILDKVVALPISQWQYKDAEGENHIGPMAQDFHAAFELGGTDTGISTLDSSGVALAAIQALEARNRALEDEVRDLKALVMQLLPQAAQN